MQPTAVVPDNDESTLLSRSCTPTPARAVSSGRGSAGRGARTTRERGSRRTAGRMQAVAREGGSASARGRGIGRGEDKGSGGEEERRARGWRSEGGNGKARECAWNGWE
eukprot:261519-Rhodomonas_salina.2